MITEIRKILKGSQELEDHILMYSGVPTNKRVAAGIAIMIRDKLKQRIQVTCL
jgi:hypothetical protein